MRSDALMDQTESICAADKLLELLRDLEIVVAGKYPDNRGHGPRHFRAMMRTSNCTDNRSVHPVWIIYAQQTCAGRLVDWIMNIQEAEEWGRK